MKVKKTRSVVLKNPFLINLRKNLRAIIREAVRIERDSLMKLHGVYINKLSRGRLTKSQERRENSIIKRESDLSAAIRKSICQCSVGIHCHREEQTKQNMVWVPRPDFESWMCVKCYENLYMGVSRDELIEDADDPCYKEMLKTMDYFIL